MTTKPGPKQSARAAALANGDKTYFTGKPCRRGHVTARYTMTGICKDCGLANGKAHYRRNYEAL
jgi:hypothetical protein